MNSYNLSAGALEQILENQKPANPILQVIGYKPMSPETQGLCQSSDELRYRLMVGDGVRAHQYCIITNQDLVRDLKQGLIEKWSIIRVTSYQTHDVEASADAAKRRLIYIMNLEILEKGSRIGKKLSVDPAATPLAPQPTMPQPMTPRNNAPTQPQPYPTPDHMKSHPAPMRSGYENQIIGIGELTPYIGKWVVKGRCTGKSAIREYNNAKGGGKLFSFTLADKSGEIKVTAFNADCERNEPFIQANKVYILGRAQVKNADKRYSRADFEITLNTDSLIEEVDDSGDVPLGRFNFVSIASLSDVQPNQPVDLIGAITTVSDMSTVISKTKNKELKKREVIIVDMSRHTIAMTIWGSSAETFTGMIGDIFVTKSARIGTYGGRSGSAGDCILINPEIPEARKIKNWYSNLIDQNFSNLTSSQETGSGGDNWKTLSQLNDLQQMKLLTSSGAPNVFSKAKVMLMSVGRNPVYKCCPTDGCGKKLFDTQSGEMECSKCGQTFTHAKYRYKTDVEIEDQTSSAWITFWDDKAEALFGITPDELERHMKMDNKESYESIIMKPNFKPYILTIKSRIETYNNEERVKHTVQQLSSFEPVSYTKHIIGEIKAMAA